LSTGYLSHGWRELVLLWLAYAGTYLLRKPLGVGKKAMGEGLGLSAQALGLFDVAMFVPYAAVQVVFGWVADRFDVRRALAALLLVSAGSMVTFGAWSSVPLLLLLLAVNGGAQSLCWSCCMKAAARVWAEPDRSRAVGIIATSMFAGGVIATGVAVRLLAMASPPAGEMAPANNDSWRNLFFLPSVILAAIAAAVWAGLRVPAAAAAGLPTAAGDAAAVAGKPGGHELLTAGQMLRIPMLPEVAMTHLLCKMVRYAFYMWLPLYLSVNLGYSDGPAGVVSMLFEVGGVAGTACVAVVKARYFRNSDVLVGLAALALGAVALVAFAVTAHGGILVNSVMLFLAGVGNCAIDAILTGTLSIKLAELSYPHATSQITGGWPFACACCAICFAQGAFAWIFCCPCCSRRLCHSFFVDVCVVGVGGDEILRPCCVVA
jgi:sugar phosphate permease